MFMTLITLIAGFAGQTQPPADASAAIIEKMKALSFLVGEWEGEGWMQMGPQERKTVKATEKVVVKLSGRALLVEGLSQTQVAAGGAVEPVHEAIGIITWDPKKSQYSMRTITAKAGAVDPKLEVGDKALVWSFETAGGSIRYTAKLNEKGQWFEIGEFSRDGKEWNKFFEMTLTKTK